LTPPKPEIPFDLEALLREMIQSDASDLHITVGQPPTFRIHGRLRPTPVETKLRPQHTEAVGRTVLDEEQWKMFEEEKEYDFSFAVENLSRFRCNIFHQRGAVALAIRAIPYEIPDFHDLNLPGVIRDFADLPRGLVLVTGPTGSGKSTTLATLIDRINRKRQEHIVTVEDPIEFLHSHKNCIVSQREVGGDTHSFADALKYVLRQDPDVVLIGEMRDLETVQAALTVAETGHLAFATLHTKDAAETINRIIDVFPAHQQEQVRTQLASVLEGVVTQALVPRSDRPGRIPATEVLVATPAIRSMIREDKVHQMKSAMQTGQREHGMQTLNDSLSDLYTSGVIDMETALKTTSSSKDLKRQLGMEAGEDLDGGRGGATRGAGRTSGRGAGRR